MTALRVLVVVLALSAAGPAAAQAGFVAGYDDLPLPPGFTETEGAGLSFDSPAGRIVEAQAQGPAGTDVLGFYAQTLPHLGWVREGEGQYRRESERLRLIAQTGPRGVTLRLTITPD